MKIIKKTNKIQWDDQEAHNKIVEFNRIITKIMKTYEFHARTMKIMTINTINISITKIMKTLNFLETYANHNNPLMKS